MFFSLSCDLHSLSTFITFHFITILFAFFFILFLSSFFHSSFLFNFLFSFFPETSVLRIEWESVLVWLAQHGPKTFFSFLSNKTNQFNKIFTYSKFLVTIFGVSITWQSGCTGQGVLCVELVQSQMGCIHAWPQVWICLKAFNEITRCVWNNTSPQYTLKGVALSNCEFL